LLINIEEKQIGAVQIGEIKVSFSTHDVMAYVENPEKLTNSWK
jgi:hypothetical protein